MAGSGADRREVVRRIVRALSLLVMLAGLAALVYVNASDWWAQYQADQHITEFSSVYDDENDPERLRYRAQAIAYNAMLAGEDPGMELMAYDEQLFYQHEPMMSYIEIPRISVRLPIYHGTSESALMAGVGHLEGTSLPIGGESVHCVLTGHSGMRNTRMFDDLHKLEAGDVFVIWTLNEPFAYEVTGSETVLPDEVVQKLRIEPGRDMVTLVTCTPYGVNSHRLLVHAQRCDYDYERAHDVGYEAYVNDRNLPLLLAMGVIALALLMMLVRKVAKRRRRAALGNEEKEKSDGGNAA